jgi:hypothetical protein
LADRILEDHDLGGELIRVLEVIESEQLASASEELIQPRRRPSPAARRGVERYSVSFGAKRLQ